MNVATRKLPPPPRKPVLLPSHEPADHSVRTVKRPPVKVTKRPAPVTPPPPANRPPVLYDLPEEQPRAKKRRRRALIHRTQPRSVHATPEGFEAPPASRWEVAPRVLQPRAFKVRTRGYKPCLCGCGAPCADYFVQGHYTRWRHLMSRIEYGEILAHRVLPRKVFEALGPWKPSKHGGLKPSKDYWVLRR